MLYTYIYMYNIEIYIDMKWYESMKTVSTCESFIASLTPMRC